MARLLAKSSFVLLALSPWILACPASLAEDGEIEKGKYQEAISIAEKAVETADLSGYFDTIPLPFLGGAIRPRPGKSTSEPDLARRR